MARVPLSASTVTRQMDETAEDAKAQLLERITESLWYTIQVDESTNVDNRATVLVFVQSTFRRICYVHFGWQPTSQLQNYSRMVSYQENRIGHFVCLYAWTEWLP